MPIENVLCPEMYKLTKDHGFKWFKTFDDEKSYTKTYDDGFTFIGEFILPMDKLPANEEEFISNCVTDAAYSVGGLYTDYQDRQRFIRDRYQTYLKFHEQKTLGKDHPFFKFKTWKEYCDRRFKVAEENTYCRVMTDSIAPESVDHCGKRFFSTPNTKYFIFDRIWYYWCVNSRNSDIQIIELKFKT